MAKEKSQAERLNLNKIRLVNVNILGINIYSPNNITSTDKNLVGFGFGFEVDEGLNQKEKLAKLILKFEIIAVLSKKAKQESKGTFNFEYIFHIENMEEYVIKRKREFLVKNVLGANLLGISYSTSRGLIIAKTKGTFLENAFLPIIHPDELVKTTNKSKKKK